MRPIPKREKNDIPKINMLPILDSIFIFIFFLLMTYQIFDFKEVSISHAEKTPQVKQDHTSGGQTPFNIKMHIKKDKTVVEIQQKDGVQAYHFKTDDKEKILSKLRQIKKQNPNHQTVIISTAPNIPFKKIITNIDLAKGGKEQNLFQKVVLQSTFKEQN